jgi:cytochrome b involved in lipid metabolism
MHYDYIIVGAGIAGLYIAHNLSKKYPSAKICILEGTNRVGGRLHSLMYKGVMIEAGGARFNTDQYRIMQLIHNLGLDTKKIQINTESKYIPVNRNYDPILETKYPRIDDIIHVLEKYCKTYHVSDEDLIKTNLFDLAYKVLGKQYPTIKLYLEASYPYYSELHSLNALEGIHLFTNEFAEKTKYFILAGGLEQLVHKLYSILQKSKNIRIHLNNPVTNITVNGNNINKNQKKQTIQNKNDRNDSDISSNSDLSTFDSESDEDKNSSTDFNFSKSYKDGQIQDSKVGSKMFGDSIFKTEITVTTSRIPKLKANNLILALPKQAIDKITIMHNDYTQNNHTQNDHDGMDDKAQNQDIGKKLHQLLATSIKTEPLYRIYAQYPLDKVTGKVWFDGIPKITTNLQIKYIIPNDYKKGVIMISYTDGKYAEYWFKQLEKGTFEEELTKQLALIFPDKVIPKPLWYKHCYWDAGAGYWKPGASRTLLMPKIIQPFGDFKIFISNENFSSHQAWVEGSLESADLVLEQFYIKPKYGISNKYSITKKINKNSNKKVIRISSRRTKKHLGGGKQKKYTLEEVAKHNKKTDAWIVVNGIVADVTKWIPQHPGGDAIMKGVGKDATTLFKAIGHDQYAKKMLKKYQIGFIQ